LHLFYFSLIISQCDKRRFELQLAGAILSLAKALWNHRCFSQVVFFRYLFLVGRPTKSELSWMIIVVTLKISYLFSTPRKSCFYSIYFCRLCSLF